MISLDFIKSAVAHPLLILRFEQDPDLALCFCAQTDEKVELKGISLFCVRESKGTVPFRLKVDIVPQLFKPRLELLEAQKWHLHIEPLRVPLTILKKKTHFVCLYPFLLHNKVKKLGHVVDIQVRARLSPLTMWFTMHGTFKQTADAIPESLVDTVECPNEFTKTIYQIFTG